MKPLKAPQFPGTPDNYEVFVRDNILHSYVPEWESDDEEELGSRQYCGLAVFANRETYRYLSRFFYALSRNLTDERGDHYHLTPNSPLTDQFDFSFELLTEENRAELLLYDGVARLPRLGPPIPQLTSWLLDAADFLHGATQQELLEQLDEAIARLVGKRDQLRSAVAPPQDA